MKHSVKFLLVLVVGSAFAPVAFAQDQATAGQTNWVAISAAFGMAIAAAVCGIGQSRVASASAEGMARNPGAADAIRGGPMLFGLVFIETLALLTFAIIMLKVS